MILITHGHHDHVNQVPECQAKYDIPAYLSEKEHPQLTPQNTQITPTQDGQVITLGNQSIRCIHTPGHSPGGQCFELPGALITGDTLFIDGCGRCDFEGSNVDDMYLSLQRLKALPDHLVVYPGHKYAIKNTDTLGQQKQTNRFLSAETEAEFDRLRMGG